MSARKRGSGAFSGVGQIPFAKAGELYSLKWDSYQTHITQGLQRFFSESDALTDVSVGSEGQYIRSHKLVLSLCSPYFKQLFETNRPDLLGNIVVMLEHIKFKDLKNVMKFIYNGEIKMINSDLKGFLEAGELLQIQGLKRSEDDDDSTTTIKATTTPKRSSDDRTIPQVLLSRMKNAGPGNSKCSSKPRSSKRPRLGQVIKPAVSSSSFDCDADDSNFSMGDVEEIEPDLVALDSTAVEDNGLNAVEGTDTVTDSGYEVVIVPSVNMKTETMEQEYQDADQSAHSNVDQFLQEDGLYNTTYQYEEGQGDQEVAGPSSALVGVGADIDVSQQTKTPGMILTVSRKGKPLLYYEGNHYRLERRGPKKTYWACLKHRHTKCHGRLSTSNDMLELLDTMGEHTHGGEPLTYYGLKLCMTGRGRPRLEYKGFSYCFKRRTALKNRLHWKCCQQDQRKKHRESCTGYLHTTLDGLEVIAETGKHAHEPYTYHKMKVPMKPPKEVQGTPKNKRNTKRKRKMESDADSESSASEVDHLVSNDSEPEKCI